MSAMVHLPASLSSVTDGGRHVRVSGTNLASVIDQLELIHPGIRAELCDEQGRLFRFVAVFVDGMDVRTLEGLNTTVGTDAEIDIIAAIAGG